MVGTSQAPHSLYPDGIGSCAFYLGAHLVEEIGKVNYLRLFGRIFYICRSLCQHCCRHYILCGPDAREIQIYGIAYKTLSACNGLDISFFLADGDDSPKGLKAFKVQIYRSAADGTASRQMYFCAAFSCKQRPHHQNRSTHLVYKLEISFCRKYIFCFYGKNILSRFGDL